MNGGPLGVASPEMAPGTDFYKPQGDPAAAPTSAPMAPPTQLGQLGGPSGLATPAPPAPAAPAPFGGGPAGVATPAPRPEGYADTPAPRQHGGGFHAGQRASASAIGAIPLGQGAGAPPAAAGGPSGIKSLNAAPIGGTDQRAPRRQMTPGRMDAGAGMFQGMNGRAKQGGGF